MCWNKWFGMRSGLAVGLVLSLGWAGQGNGWAAEKARETPDLTGVVVDGKGKPLQKATVFIYTAGPKEGAGILCPSCYVDCRKRTTADQEGRFKIEDLDPSLLFRVLVVAEGHRPQFVSKIDPAVKPIEVTLKPGKTGISPDQQVKGRVLGSDNKPLSGAVVSIRGVTRGKSTRFGGNEDVDQVAVTDDDGKFALNGEGPFAAAIVEVESRGHAKGLFQRLVTGGKDHELRLTEGASVEGRLIKGGKPVTGAEIGISGADRNAEIYVGDFSVGTDQRGKFHLVNLPPSRDYFLFGRMSSLTEKGAVPARRVRLQKDGSVLDLGDIELARANKIAGQIRLSDGKPLPPKTRVLLSRSEAWDSAQSEADEQGRFQFLDVPSESIELTVRVKGYRLSARNKSLDPMNPYHLVGLLKADKTDLVLDFEPGASHEGSRGNYIDIRQKPLLGAEAVTAQN